jgi:hypothetical protein
LANCYPLSVKNKTTKIGCLRVESGNPVAAHQSATDHRGCIISLRCKVGDWQIIVALPALVRGHLGGLWLEPLVSSNMATIATTNDTLTYVQVTC